MTSRAISALAIAAALAAVPAAARTSGSAEIWATQGEDCFDAIPAADAWRDKSLSPQCRARAVLTQFETLAEKLRFLGDSGSDEVRDVAAELGLPRIVGSDGPAGLTAGDAGATALPSPITVAASFDREIAKAYGAVLADEFRASGRGLILGPAYDIARNWKFGRLSESMGEDPFLTGEMAAAEVGALSEGGVMAMMKHFAVYTQEEGRVGDQPSGAGQTGDNIVSERAMREIFLPGFRAAVQRGGAGAVMCSFPRINGVYACENPHLFDILKREWGFDGYVGPDFPSAQRSIARAVIAGLDSGSVAGNPRNAALVNEKHLLQAVRDGEVPERRIDDMILRRLVPAFRLGLMDNPPVKSRERASTPQNRAKAADILAAGTVLLRNEGGILPFGANVKSIALIGTQATGQAVLVQQGSPYVKPSHANPAVAAIAARAGSAVTLTHEPGTLGLGPLPPADPDNFTTPSGEPGFLARYYTSADLDSVGEPVAENVVADPSLAAAPAIAGLPENNKWLVRYDSVFTPKESGVHRFTLHGSGSARLWVDGELAGEFSRADFGNAVFANVELAGGRPIDIRIEYTPRAALRDQRMEMFGLEMGLTLRFGHAGPDDLVARAAAAAAKTDVAVVFASELVGEGMDRHSLNLQGDQDRLIEAVARANPRTVVVLNTGGPVAMPWLDEVAGVMEMWMPGDAFGEAVSGLLFGDRAPGGRLPVTFPAEEAQGAATKPHQMPGVIDPVTGELGEAYFEEGVFVGYRYFDEHGQEPLFPFGYGLSYADIAMDVSGVKLDESGNLVASMTLANRSGRPGKAVPQLYLGLPEQTNSPPWQLKGFAAFDLAPGESRTVNITVSAQALQYWDTQRNGWRTAPGIYRLRVGRNSRDAVWEGTFEVGL